MGKEKEKDQIRLGTYLTYVKSELENESKCLELPFSFLLLISFSLMALLHLGQDKVYTVEQSLRFDIVENANFAWAHNFGHKTIVDVNSIADFWSWFRIGFLPLVVPQSWGYSEDLQAEYDALAEGTNYTAFSTANLPTQWQLEGYSSDAQEVPIRDDYLRHNRIIGGIRIRQERAEAGYDLCRFPSNIDEELWRSWWGKPCMPANPSYELPPTPVDAEAFQEPRRIEWLLSSQLHLIKLLQKTVDMEDGCAELEAKGRPGACLCTTCLEDGLPLPWLDEQTQRVEVGFIVFNAEYNLVSLVTSNFFFNRGGRIHKFVHVQSSYAQHFSGDVFEVAGMVISDVVFLASLMWVFVSESVEIVRVVRSSKSRFYVSLAEDYIGFWNAIDWISIGTSALICILFAQLLVSTSEVVESFQLLATESIVGESAAGDPARIMALELEMEDFFEQVEEMCAIERVYRQSFCIYPMVVMLRLFKSFAAQPRLAVVTSTLSSSLTDMGHFFIIFFSVFFCMVVNSVLIFGQDIPDFATLPRALFTNFRGMFGDWDWEAMKSTDRYMAGVWFWLFVVIMMVLLLNMLLAILMDAYSVVNGEVEDAVTLPEQISGIVRRRRQFLAGERVRLTDVWNAYFKLYKDEKEMLSSALIITPEDIKETVPGIPLMQAIRTLKQAKKIEEKTNLQFGVAEVQEFMEKISDRSRVVRDTIKSVVSLVKLYELERPHPTRSFLQKSGSSEVDADRLVVDTVSEVIGGLGDELDKPIRQAVQSLQQRQQVIESQQQDIHISIKDTHQMLQQLRLQTDSMIDTMRKLVQERRRKDLMPKHVVEGRLTAGRILDVCSVPGWSDS